MVGALIGVIAAGSILEAWGADSAAKAKARALKEAAERQARAYETAAAETLQAGEAEAFVTNLKGEEVKADARTAMAANRLDGGEDALFKTQFFTALDVDTIKMNARRAAWGLRESASEVRRQGDANARAVREEGKAQVARSLIGGASDIAGVAYKYGGAKAAASGYAGDAATGRDWYMEKARP